MLDREEQLAARDYSRGDSSQIVALAIVLARRLGWSIKGLIAEVNEVLPEVRAER